MLFCNRKIIFDYFCYRYCSASKLKNTSFVFINIKSCSKIWLCLRNQNHGVEDYFEYCFLSQRMHLAKPDARIYEEVVRQANIHPDETLFIDDLKENCEAAEKLGIHTFQNVKFDDWLSLRF